MNIVTMERHVIYISSAAGAAAVLIVAVLILANNQSTLSSETNNNSMLTTADSNQSAISSSQQAAAQVPTAGHVFISLGVVPWDPGAVESWIKSHPEDFSNQVILDDSMLVKSPVLQKALQAGVGMKYAVIPSTYTLEPLPTSDLDSIISVIGASKFVQASASTDYEESRALVKYGDDYLYVTIAKTTTS